jgi:hypothetical protein
MRNAYKILDGKSEWKRPLGRPRRRWDDNIRKDHRVVRCEEVDWIHLAQDRGQLPDVVDTVTKIQVP